MFWILALLVPVGYATQTALLLRYGRAHDPVSMGMYRGLSLGLSFLPVLFFVVGPEDIRQTLQFWPQIALASVLVGITVVLSFYVMKYLPLGILTAWMTSLKVTLMSLFGMYFFQEILSPFQVIFIGVTILGIVFLSLQKHHADHLRYKCPKRLFGLVFFQALTLAIGVMLIADVARQASSWVAGYLWEVGIGLTAMFCAFGRQLSGGAGIEKIPVAQFWRILLYSSPTVLGTGAFFLASTMGPIGILTAVATLEMVIGTLLAWWWYHERLNQRQWAAIAVVFLGILGLKLFS